MDNELNEKTAPEKSGQRRWPPLPFDATTNFSIIGWLLDKLRKSERPAEHIDLSL